MNKVSGKLTVYFEEPFWVGVFERIEDGKLSVTKVTFGAEPKDYEVQESGIGTKSQQALKLQQEKREKYKGHESPLYFYLNWN